MSKPADAEQLLLRLEWTVIRRLDGLLHGDYRCFFRGPGIDLADLREYQYHDDVRHIDWNVTARMQTPYVRVFNEDRDLTAWFLLDLSASLDFGARVKKQAVSAQFVGVLARLLTRHGNRVGALCYGSSVDTVVPARSGRRHVLHLLHALLARPVTKPAPTQLTALLDHAARIVPRRSLVFVVSDFISAPGWDEALARLAMRHEVIAVRLSDPLSNTSSPTSACCSCRTPRAASSCSSIPTTRPSASASPSWPCSAKRPCASASPTPASMRWSYPPTAI